MNMWKRACKNPNDTDDVCEKYTSTFETTGIPVIIGLSLFAILGVIMFVIVRKKRQRSHALEAERHKDIDDGVELDFAAASHKRGYPGPPLQQQLHQPQQYQQPAVEDDPYGVPPPKYAGQ